MEYESWYWKSSAGRGLALASAEFAPRPDTTDAIVLGEVWENDTYRLDPDVHFNRDSRVVVDVGANIGAFTVLCARFGARVIAAELDLDNVERIRDHVQHNELDYSVRIRHVAVLSGSEIATVGVGGTPGAGNYWVDGFGDVPTMGLDELVAGEPVIDVMKIDTEGAEYPIILGASLDTLRKVRYLVMEFHANAEPGPGRLSDKPWGEMVEKLSECFNVEIVGRASVGGLIFATNPYT